MARRRQPPRAGALQELSPLWILTQIVLLQTAWYVVATALILFTTLVAGRVFTPDLILGWQSLRGDTATGWTLGLCWMMDSLIGVIFLLLLVSRSKLVPDFALTIHFIHLVIVSLYARALPRNVLWWLLQFASSALMVSLGIWTCQWRELKPLSFGGAGGKNATTNSSSRGHGDSRDDAISRAKITPMLPGKAFEPVDIEAGRNGATNGGPWNWLRNAGRSGESDRGNYEMVRMSDHENS